MILRGKVSKDKFADIFSISINYDGNWVEVIDQGDFVIYAIEVRKHGEHFQKAIESIEEDVEVSVIDKIKNYFSKRGKV